MPHVVELHLPLVVGQQGQLCALPWQRCVLLSQWFRVLWHHCDVLWHHCAVLWWQCALLWQDGPGCPGGERPLFAWLYWLPQ